MPTHFIAGFVLATILAAIVFGCITRADHKKYEDMRECLNKRIDRLVDDVDYFRNKWSEGYIDTVSSKTKIELYEAIIDKLLGKQAETTDSVFIFEGKIYRPVNFRLSRGQGEVDTLDVEFVKGE